MGAGNYRCSSRPENGDADGIQHGVDHWQAALGCRYLYQSLLAATNSVEVAQQHYDNYLVQVFWQTLLLIVVFVVLLLFAARVMLRQLSI